MGESFKKEGEAIMNVGERAFIESPNFPVSEISEASGKEKGPGRPPHWEMVFWWTRKPLISARAVIAGCLLPENTDKKVFLRSIGFTGHGSPHRNRPYYRFDGVELLDPFAGFGSIPLEAVRLGLSATAVELLPVAYIFLKAVLEYPAKYRQELIKDVKKWGNWIVEQLKEDQDIKELYDEDVAVYIGSWEIKCPNCNRWTPLVGNWWLARVKTKVKEKEVYVRLAWMEPIIKNDRIEIKVVDLNKQFGVETVKMAKVQEQKVTLDHKEFRVPESNIEARRELATCLLCNKPIMQVDPDTGKHYTETKNLQENIKKRLEGYVKYAIKIYNQSLFQDDITLLARQKLLVKVKVKNDDLEFEPCTPEDQLKLEKAKEKVKKLLAQNDPDIPREKLAPYGTQAIGGYLQPLNYYMDEWYKLFNPRQLLTLVKLVKLIREAGKKVEKENLNDERNKEEARKYAEALIQYLSLMLLKYVDHNTLCTCWHPVLLIIAHTLSMRGIAMMWNWTDENVLTRFTGSWIRNQEIVIKSLNYLFQRGSSCEVALEDAAVLQKVGQREKFDLIVTDPPYYDDVPYAELSDFYYVWLKRALSDVEGGRLVPRFLPEAFFERVGDGWVEVSTQWEKYALSEVSLNPPRLGPSANYQDGERHFQKLLNSSFVSMVSRVKDNGLIVTYYAHTDPAAWKALLEAGWSVAGLRITNAFPLATESSQSVVKRGKLSMDTSIVVVWRKGCEGIVNVSKVYSEIVEAATTRARQLMDVGVTGRDLVIGTLAAALATATKYREVRDMGKIDAKTLVDKYVYPATYLGLAKALAMLAELRDGVKSSDAMFYLLVKSTLAGAKKKTLDSTDLRLFAIGTTLDVKMAINSWKILRAAEESGAKVAKAKTLTLIEPTSSERSKLEELLEYRGISTTNPNVRCSVDALHIIEYYAVTYPREEFRRKLEELKANNIAQVNEALSLARILAKVLPEEDVEKALCERIVEHMSPTVSRLTSFSDEVR